MKRSIRAAALGGLLLSFGCSAEPEGTDPVAGEAEPPPAALATGMADPAAAAKEESGAWESLAGPLGETQPEALAAAEARLEVLGERLAELMPPPGNPNFAEAQEPWNELQERVDRVRRDVVRLGAATEAEWPAVKADLEESFSAIDAMLQEEWTDAPVG